MQDQLKQIKPECKLNDSAEKYLDFRLIFAFVIEKSNNLLQINFIIIEIYSWAVSGGTANTKLANQLSRSGGNDSETTVQNQTDSKRHEI